MITGIILHASVEILAAYYLVAAAIAVLLSLLRRRFLYLVVLTLSALNVHSIRPPDVALGERGAVFSGVVYGENQYERYSKLIVHVDRVILAGDTIDYRCKAQYYAFGGEVFFGKRITVKGRLVPSRRAHQPAQLTGKIIASSARDHLFGMILNPLKGYIDRLLRDLLRDDNYMIASGLVLGGSGRLREELKEVFSRAGVLHILAVSGLHVGFVGIFLGAMLLFVPMDHKIKFTIIALGLVVYAGVTGFRPSVGRATLMAFLFGAALVSQRNVSGIHIVNVTAIVFLLFDPLLLFDVSAQLSFSAVYGILYLYPRLEQHLLKRVRQRILRVVLRPMAVSFSAQVFVAPFVLLYFHRLPLYAVLTNLLIVPIASAIIFLLFLCFAVGWMWFGLATVIALPAGILISILVAVSGFAARMPYSAIGLAISPLLILPFYCLFWQRMRRLAVWLMLITISVFSLARSIPCISICSGEGAILVATRGGEHILLTEEVTAGQRVFLGRKGITGLDYLVSRSPAYPAKKSFVELPGKMQFAELTYDDIKIRITDRVRINFHDFEKEYSWSDLKKQGKNEMVTEFLTDGKNERVIESSIYGTVIDQVLVDLQLILHRLTFLF